MSPCATYRWRPSQSQRRALVLLQQHVDTMIVALLGFSDAPAQLRCRTARSLQQVDRDWGRTSENTDACLLQFRKQPKWHAATQNDSITQHCWNNARQTKGGCEVANSQSKGTNRTSTTEATDSHLLKHTRFPRQHVNYS